MSPRVVLTRLTGQLDVEVADAFMSSLEDWMRLGGEGLEAFHDWEGVEDYQSEARSLLTPWSTARQKSFSSVHVLVRGRAVAWGLQIVNAILGGLMTIHHDRREFDRALARSTGARAS